jgi:hypothetical protein
MGTTGLPVGLHFTWPSYPVLPKVPGGNIPAVQVDVQLDQPGRKFLCRQTPCKEHASRLFPAGYPTTDSRYTECGCDEALWGGLIGFMVESFRLIGDRVLVNDPEQINWPITIPQYGRQWAGAGPYDIIQTPDNPRMVNLFNTFVEGKIDEAMEMYWGFMKGMPGGDSMGGGADSYFHTGIVSTLPGKYSQWLLGGNGGMLRQPMGQRLYDYQKEMMRARARRLGVPLRDNEEQFFVGRVNYSNGARMKQY